MNEQERAAAIDEADAALGVTLMGDSPAARRYHKLAEHAVFLRWFHYEHPDGEYSHGRRALPNEGESCPYWPTS